MIIKLLGIELNYNSEINKPEIIVKYGKILDNQEFKDLDNQIKRIKSKIIKIIERELKG